MQFAHVKQIFVEFSLDLISAEKRNVSLSPPAPCRATLLTPFCQCAFHFINSIDVHVQSETTARLFAFGKQGIIIIIDGILRVPSYGHVQHNKYFQLNSFPHILLITNLMLVGNFCGRIKLALKIHVNINSNFKCHCILHICVRSTKRMNDKHMHFTFCSEAFRTFMA